MAERDFLPDEAGAVREARTSAEAPVPATDVSGEDALRRLESDITAVLQTIYDPEVPVDIYEMGLIYEVDVRPGGEVYIKMTLTSPMCPVAETLPPEVETKVRGVEGVSNVVLDLVWDPPWHPDMMSEAARLELNM